MVLPVPARRPRFDRAVHHRPAGAQEADAAVREHGAAGKRRSKAADPVAASADNAVGAVPFTAHRRDGRAHARRSDTPQPRRGDAGDRRLTVHARDRRAAQSARRRAGRRQAVCRRAHAGYQPRIDRLRRYCDRAGVADDQPRSHQARGRQAAAGRPHRHRRGHLHRAAGHRHRRCGDRWRRRPAPGADRAAVRW